MTRWKYLLSKLNRTVYSSRSLWNWTKFPCSVDGIMMTLNWYGVFLCVIFYLRWWCSLVRFKFISGDFPLVRMCCVNFLSRETLSSESRKKRRFIVCFPPLISPPIHHLCVFSHSLASSSSSSPNHIHGTLSLSWVMWGWEMYKKENFCYLTRKMFHIPW